METTHTWAPTPAEIERIVAELRPVIDECEARFDRFLAEVSLVETAVARRTLVVAA